MNYPFQRESHPADTIYTHEDEAYGVDADVDEEAEHHAREAQEIAHSTQSNTKVALVIQQGFAQNAASTLYFYACTLSNRDVWVQLHFSVSSVGSIRKLVALKELSNQFGSACSFEPEDIIANALARDLGRRLDTGDTTRSVDYEGAEMFPPEFRTPHYWRRMLQCTGMYPNVLAGITMLRFHKRGKGKCLTEITFYTSASSCLAPLRRR